MTVSLSQRFRPLVCWKVTVYRGQFPSCSHFSSSSEVLEGHGLQMAVSLLQVFFSSTSDALEGQFAEYSFLLV